MQVTNEYTTDWWVQVFWLTHCIAITLILLNVHPTLCSDLYWIDCTVPLEKFLELKHYQVPLKTSFLFFCIQFWPDLQSSVWTIFLGWEKYPGKILWQEIHKSKRSIATRYSYGLSDMYMQDEEAAFWRIWLCSQYVGPAWGVQCTELPHARFEAEKTEQDFHHQTAQ